MSCNLRTKPTVFCPTFLIAEKGRKGIWSKKSFIRRKVCRGVNKRSDAVRRLPSSVPHRQYYCALSADTASVQLTAVNMHQTTFRCSDVRWMRLHPVLPALPVMTAQLDAPATLTAIFQRHDIRRLWFLSSQFFVVAHFNNMPSNFSYVSPLTTAICKQSPVYCPRCSERNTASVILRILCCFKKFLHFIM